MPTPVAHSLAGLSLYLLSGRRRQGQEDLVLAGACWFAALAPDLDFTLNFITGQNYHHHFTHSFGFTALVTLAVYLLARKFNRPRDTLWIALAYLSHLFLDLFSKDTAVPNGMELFWPFSNVFVIAPFSIFEEVWRGSLARLFGLHNWLAVGREVLILGPLVLLAWWWRGGKKSAAND